MKIAFIDVYNENSSPHKDPISIPRGLAAFGHQVELVTISAFDAPLLFGFPVRPLQAWLDHALSQDRPDLVVAISRFNPALTPALRSIKAAGIPLIVKGDTDGSLGYPIPPNYLRSRPVTAHPLNLFRQIKWRAPVARYVRPRLEHVELADLVVCESPGAAVNLTYLLDHWQLDGHARKVVLIPNSVSPVTMAQAVSEERQATIVSIGRWDDRWCKGSDLLAGVISKVAPRHPGAKFVVVGNSPEYVSRGLGAGAREQVTFTGPLPFEDVQAVLSTAQVLLVPSRFESFSLVSAEALCMGASLVVTPVESLVYLAGGGAYGSVARDFSVEAISAALSHELHTWSRSARDPLQIAAHWRATLNEDRLARTWQHEMEKLKIGLP